MCEVKLQRWSVSNNDNGYLAPECRVSFLRGRVYGHPNPRFADGDRVDTSRITAIDGRRITCYSGRVYVLGQIHPRYRAWLKRKRLKYDPREPVKVKKGGAR